MKSHWIKFFGLTMLLAGMAGAAFAGADPVAPEIDSATGAGALTLFAGALLMIRGRRKGQS